MVDGERWTVRRWCGVVAFEAGSPWLMDHVKCFRPGGGGGCRTTAHVVHSFLVLTAALDKYRLMS